MTVNNLVRLCFYWLLFVLTIIYTPDTFIENKELFLLNISVTNPKTLLSVKANYIKNQTRGMPGAPQQPRTWGWFTNNMHNGVVKAANLRSRVLVFAQDHVFSWHTNSLSIITTLSPQRTLPTASAIGPKSNAVTFDFDPQKQAADTEKEITRLLAQQRGTLNTKQENLIVSLKQDELNNIIQFPKEPRAIPVADVDRAIHNFPMLDRFFPKVIHTQIPEKQPLRDDLGNDIILFIKASATAKSDDTLHAAKTMETTLKVARIHAQNDPLLKKRLSEVDEMISILQAFQKFIKKDITEK
jgi:hypothetical protein